MNTMKACLLKRVTVLVPTERRWRRKMQLDVEVSPPAFWVDFNRHCTQQTCIRCIPPSQESNDHGLRDATQSPGKSAIFSSLKIAIPPSLPLVQFDSRSRCDFLSSDFWSSLPSGHFLRAYMIYV